jgi:putative tricarboxylic transport membrane protein
MGALLALGLPTSATAAIMLAAFQQYGLQPGPMLFERNSELVWALLASLFVGLVMLLVLNLPFAPLWAKLLLIPKPYLYAGITVFCGLGVYATSAAVSDLLIVLLIGALGFVLRRYGFPLAPIMIGVVLGPLAETSLRNAMMSSGGEVAVLVESPVTWALYGVLGLVLLYTVWKRLNTRVRQDV